VTAAIDSRQAREGLSLLGAGIVQAMALAMRSAVQATEASAKATTQFHDRTGSTRSTFRGEAHGRTGFVTLGDMSKLLDSGTRPHAIQGRPVLRFVVNGSVLYRRMVNHPGTAERPFAREARALGEQTLAYGVEYFVGEAIRRA
jgi:hypothetical protein